MLPTAFRPIFPLILDSCHGGSCFDVNFSRAPTLLAINVDYSREILQFHRISTQLSCPMSIPSSLRHTTEYAKVNIESQQEIEFCMFCKMIEDERCMVWGGCSYWHLASNPTDPGELSWKEKYPPFSQTFLLSLFASSRAFSAFCKNVTTFVILRRAATAPAPLRNESKWRLHCCKNSSLYSLLHKYTRRRSTAESFNMWGRERRMFILPELAPFFMLKRRGNISAPLLLFLWLLRIPRPEER